MPTIAVEVKPNKITFGYCAEGENVFQIDKIIIARDESITNNDYLKEYIRKRLNKDEVNLRDTFSVLDFFDKYREEYKDKKNSEFGEDDSLFISDSKKVFYLQTYNYTCLEVNQFDANGSGANFAIGAYKFSKDIKKSLEIACNCSKETNLPIKFLELKI